MCRESFSNMRSLFVHMRRHPDPRWRDILPPELDNCTVVVRRTLFPISSDFDLSESDCLKVDDGEEVDLTKFLPAVKTTGRRRRPATKNAPCCCHVSPSGRRSCQSPELATASELSALFRVTVRRSTISISAAMYGRLISFAINKNVPQSTIRVYYPSNFISSVATNPNNKDPNLVDDIRGSASSSTGKDDRVNAVKSSTTPPSSSTSERGENGGDMASFVAETAKQGAVKAVETGLDIGEMAKKTLDNAWDVTKDVSHKVKEAVAGDREETERVEDVPVTDHFVEDLRKRADGYDLKKK
ncbi:hypothetical protein L6452_00387 [Arctium lappa]|uniref:Uncharacterized protein n=1 Tax=Arctium lappa TaxID=4217 RepID=A0ACB9FF15_ARCLA|nr:hypothetical protein L6452_00387 [Arctium lappa]